MRELPSQKVKRVHPYAWIWESLADDPSFVLRPMFGGQAIYLDGKLMLFLAARGEPWRGLLICTERGNHSWLMARFPELRPHEILPKWLYLPEANDAFERIAEAITNLARKRDPRIGIIPPSKKHPRR